ncbi:MAG: OsmC family protein [Deltaproteobacteria bacterium]|nr:OsmC family protein [Deltaproteobacteria bacterium]MBI3293658.1 OsmC family protein [Deltaproteobacteria bacterium]
MSEHRATVTWKRTTPDFVYETYDRTHEVRYEGGIQHKASAAKEFAGKPEFANPEELFAGALASCHMLTFLAVAAKSRLTVDSYTDTPVAHLDKNATGKLAVTKTVLRPRVTFSKETPVTREKLVELHDKAHRNCFIANSVACEVITEIVD